jgi:hypothetical protein
MSRASESASEGDFVLKFVFPGSDGYASAVGERGGDPDRQERNWNWTTFALIFDDLFPRISHVQAPPKCSWAVGTTLRETMRNYRAAETPFVPEIEGVIRKLCTTGVVFMPDAPSKASEYFLGLRSAVLKELFFQLSIFERAAPHSDDVNTSALVPFPSLPAQRVAEWFLVQWWRKWGVLKVSELRHLEAFLED